ncbi:NADH-quinone oxidoreductase subunit A [Halobacteriales archaeon SW_5_70_135]|nr:MAG: NADH-quinone oxidoreductase subunit A [Halobacteriales archaeon SW_5_70_135]
MLGVVAVLIPLGMMTVSWLLRPSVPEQSKRSTYESGEVPTGDTRVRFKVQYYMVALLFLIFDIETVLVFPWTVIYRRSLSAGVGLERALVPMLVFIGVLLVALAWAWRSGAVEWARSSASPGRDDRARRRDRQRRRGPRRGDRERPTTGGAGTASESTGARTRTRTRTQTAESGGD